MTHKPPVDELGLPIKRPRGRPINPEKFKGTYRVKAYKRKRGSWPDRIENMRVGDAASNSQHFTADKYDQRVAQAWFEKESHAIRKATMRVRQQKPEYRLRTFEITRSKTDAAQFATIITLTLTRVS